MRREHGWIPALLLLLSPAVHADDLELTFGGKVQTDLRFRVEEKSVGQYYQQLMLPVGVSRNENILKLKLGATYGDFAGVAEVDFVVLGYSNELGGLADLSLRREVDPYRFEAHALYLEAVDLGVDGLDLRIGQQLVQWGKGDMFNPTNNLNANDVEDPLLFGEQLANLMVKVDYSFGNDWTISGVLVPIFKPALLPNSAPLGTAAVDRLPFTSADLRHRVHAEKAAALMQTVNKRGIFPTVVTSATPVLPETSLENMQLALRVAGVLFDQDIALSYYNGRSDIPQPFLNATRQEDKIRCNPDKPGDCITGLLKTDTYMMYPRMQVAGLNMAGELDLLGWISDKIRPIGYRLELGVFFPQEVTIGLYTTTDILGEPAGEYSYKEHRQDNGWRPAVVNDTPFTKWVVGLDYTFNRYLYVNAQWVHGFPDEFGAGDWITEGWAVRKGTVSMERKDVPDLVVCALLGQAESCGKTVTELMRPRLGDYLVLGVDFRFMSEKALLRLFTIWDLSGIHEEKWDAVAKKRVRTHHNMFSAQGFSAVIYPEFVYNFGNGLELGAGALLMLGKDHTKFGDPATGGSQVWTRARFSY